MNKKLPSKLFRLNRVAKAVDDAIIEFYKKDNRYNFIQEKIPSLEQQPKPSAFKEISKVLYVNNIEPPISKQGHDTKLVLGATGEALTELLFSPKPDVKTNNRGFDINIDGCLIEVKSTVEESVSLSNVQYSTADYLIIHVFHKYNDSYLRSYMVPMSILRVIKGEKKGRVSVNIDIEHWVKNFYITPIRISQYFKIRERYITGKYRSIVQVINRMHLDALIQSGHININAIFKMYSEFNSWKLEPHFAYYEYFFNKKLKWIYTYKSL